MVTISAVTADENDTVTWRAYRNESEANEALRQTIGRSIQFQARNAGVYEVTAEASGGSATSIFISVANPPTEPNHEPELRELLPLADPPFITGDLIHLFADVFDPDGDEISYTWEASRDKTDVTAQVLTSAKGKRVPFSADTTGNYQITVSYTDGRIGDPKKHGLSLDVRSLVTIGEPEDGQEVLYITLVRGEYLEERLRGQVPYVFVHPHNVDLWFPQKASYIMADGRWESRCLIGDGKDRNVGEKFDIGVILLDIDEAIKLSEEAHVKPIEVFNKRFQAKVTVTREMG